MDFKPAHSLLTAERLIGSRWIFANQLGHEYSRSFYFGKDGLIKVFRCRNEHSWTLKDGLLRIFDDRGDIHWLFDVIVQTDDDTIGLFGRCQKPIPNVPWFSLVEFKKPVRIAEDVEIAAEETAPAEPGKQEGIRLVIWDLDETFWRGTLTEGGVEPVPSHIELIETLTRRGIVNAICSKNHFEDAKRALERFGVWDNFVFPEIAFSPKGAMIKNIVKNAQLRPETIMFIDDNKMNLNEALHYVPKLQVAEPDFIANMLDDPRFAGKPDPQKTRLARYKILETKLQQKSASNGDNEQFLRNSKIRVSLHSNVEDEFPRIHDLVNRTNQLNFTKRRWSEDIEEARAQFRRETEPFGTHCGYVKVSDQYGDYGIVGFYMCAFDNASHFLFSCRTLNMGVEQFVWKKLDRPHININGSVVSDLDMDVDWITLVNDAGDNAAAAPSQALTICIRGACDMMMTSQFLRAKANTIEEFNYIYMGWTIFSLPRVVAAYAEMLRPENQAILQRLPGIPKNSYASDVFDATADVYVLSFPQESFCGYYRVKSTGLILPMSHGQLWPHEHVKRDYTAVPYEQLLERKITGISREQWDTLRTELEFIGGFDEARFIADVRWMFTHLQTRNKPVIILGLNGKVGRNVFVMNFFSRINAIVRPIAEEFGFPHIDITQFIHTEDDLAKDGALDGTHFARPVYAKIAEEIFKFLPPPPAIADIAA
jgi:FkbH-like protein